MSTDEAGIIAQIRTLERQLETLQAQKRTGIEFGPERGRGAFDAEVARRHKARKRSLWVYLFTADPLCVLVSPVIYSLIIPFVLGDVWISIYQAICFRAYGIPQVKRHRYLIFDRAGLPYLNLLEKLNCAFCSYCNGVIAYVREVAARTEQHWCPIKHAKRMLGAHPRYAAFSEYGDGDDYRTHLLAIRKAMREEPDEGA
jgi:hypothetical protein